MKKYITLAAGVIAYMAFMFLSNTTPPLVTNLTYDNITQNSITLYWNTDIPTDSKVKWFRSDSNYQPLVFTDSIYNSASVTNHSVVINNLQSAKIYKYQITSGTTGSSTTDSGYFITQSNSTGRTNVYFNHTVDTTVSTGEKAKGNQNFEALFLNRIDSALYSIDIALFAFNDITTIATALINAKNRGVKIRFVYDATANTPMLDTIIANGIPVVKRNYLTTASMHNKFLIFDYRYNSAANRMFLWTGSTNVTHPQFHSDKNNIIEIQDESLCAIYTREFEEMWGAHTDQPNVTRARFGPQKVNNVPHIVNAAGTRMEVYFSPSDSVPNFLNNLILSKTSKSVFFCVLRYSLTSMENAMHTVFNNGRQIKGVFDLSKLTDSNCTYPRMKGLQVPLTWNPPADVYIDSSTGLLHHKYLVIDANSGSGNKITVTGSYNWDIQATYLNDENSLTIFSPRINNLYYQEFYKRFRGAGGGPVSVLNSGENIPEEITLHQNYPNPFNSETNIRIELTKPERVKIVLYDITGKEIEVIADKIIGSGIQNIKFNSGNLSTGIYFYRMTSGKINSIKKMVIMR